VSDAGQHDLIYVGQECFESFTPKRGLLGKGVADLAGTNLSQNRQRLDALIVVRDPIHNLFAMLPKLLGSHVKALFWRHPIPLLAESKPSNL
jgi:hypothetical protein